MRYDGHTHLREDCMKLKLKQPDAEVVAAAHEEAVNTQTVAVNVRVVNKACISHPDIPPNYGTRTIATN